MRGHLLFYEWTHITRANCSVNKKSELILPGAPYFGYRVFCLPFFCSFAYLVHAYYNSNALVSYLCGRIYLTTKQEQISIP